MFREKNIINLTVDAPMHKNFKRVGSLEVICGPMFSGKSEELIRRLRRAKIAQQRVAVFKHAIDDRYNLSAITSHNGTKLDAHPTSNGFTILDIVKQKDYTVVGVDEVQFYTNDIIAAICSLIDWNVRVIVAGLDLDFRGVPFGPTPTLLALADSVTKLRAICTLCGNDAHFSQRLSSHNPSRENSVVMVGGADTYVARCRDCYGIDTPQRTSPHQQIEQ
jgi:thymidine kinase